MKNAFCELEYWVQCYLHQDFQDEFGSADGALHAYIAEEPPEKIEKLKQDLAEIVRQNHDEGTLRHLLLVELHCGYYYPIEWGGARDWLRHVQKVLNQ